MFSKVSIDGMNCQHCVKSVTEKLNGVEGVTSIVVNLEEKNAVVESAAPLDEALMTKSISDAGFSVTGITVQ
ncbi:heavy-metal-associated domain-containing protein [bacterium]|nr:heavy-metal-associated domain-containing protein [bacterium]